MALCLIVAQLLLWSDFARADESRCAALKGKPLGDEVKVEAATLAPASAQAPEDCDVRGVIAPEANFAVKLPTDWNQRLYMVGGGGYAAQLSLGPMNADLQKGYATATTDTGHHAQLVHNTAVLAKQIINQADWFTPLVEWVAGSRVVSGATVMTRPLCSYPQVARCKGSGDVKKAENFIYTIR